jgi:hypothetical protein
MMPRRRVTTITRNTIRKEIASTRRILAQASPASIDRVPKMADIDRVPKMADFESDSTSAQRMCELIERF